MKPSLLTSEPCSVVLPTLNEASNLPTILPRIGSALRDSTRSEIIVVDDDSSDDTAGVAHRAGKEHELPLRVFERKGERSLSLSVVEGARLATHDAVVVLDADGSHDPRAIPRLLEPLFLGRAEVVVGSRHTEGGKIGPWGLHRRVLSGTGTLLARALTRVRDPLSGFFACRRELLTDPGLRPKGYKILLEVLLRHPLARVVEVPIVFADRESGESKFGLRQAMQFATQLLGHAINRVRAPRRGGVSRQSARQLAPLKEVPAKEEGAARESL